MAQAQEFAPFYEQEGKFRREMEYPPFARLINLRIEGNKLAEIPFAIINKANLEVEF